MNGISAVVAAAVEVERVREQTAKSAGSSSLARSPRRRLVGDEHDDDGSERADEQQPATRRRAPITTLVSTRILDDGCARDRGQTRKAPKRRRGERGR